ncbi:hypothetical protein [Phocaeicola paurosaccharolyticus]|uniref:hypothetical protein n=1 Tax=Phocaeicola paurosaccharolyticus TaxID=732242 RepID=UPI000468B84D|nr:hypothetical protein [Phocaeicola paurosaccharolyticus]
MKEVDFKSQEATIKKYTDNISDIQVSEETKRILLCKALSCAVAYVREIMETMYGKLYNNLDEPYWLLDNEITKVLGEVIDNHTNDNAFKVL